jgi:2-dehydropantoate 2-reductase
LNVLVVGAGAVGTWFGRILSEIGCSVTFAPRELADVQKIEVDLAVVAVKSYDTAGAIATLKAALGEESTTAILTLQNGIGNEEALGKAFGIDNIIAGALTVPVERGPDGTIDAANRGGLAIAPVGRQAHNWLLAALNTASVPLKVYQDYRSLKWSKLTLNLLMNASCAILNFPPARILAEPDLFELEMEMLREVDALMSAAKLARLNLPQYPVKTLLAVARLPGGVSRALLGNRIVSARGSKLPSLLIDLRAEKHTSEVAWLNGAVAGAARSLSIQAPVNAAYARVLEDITTMPALWAKYREHPEVLLAEVSAERRRFS